VSGCGEDRRGVLAARERAAEISEIFLQIPCKAAAITAYTRGWDTTLSTTRL